MAHHEDSAFTRYWFNLLKRSEYEDCSLSESGLGLAKDIRAQDRLRNAYLLDCSEAKGCQNWFPE